MISVDFHILSCQEHTVAILIIGRRLYCTLRKIMGKEEESGRSSKDIEK